MTSKNVGGWEIVIKIKIFYGLYILEDGLINLVLPNISKSSNLFIFIMGLNSLILRLDTYYVWYL